MSSFKPVLILTLLSLGLISVTAASIQVAPILHERTNSASKVISCKPVTENPAELFWTGPHEERIDNKPKDNVFSVSHAGGLSLIVQKNVPVEEGKYTCHEVDRSGGYYLSTFNLQLQGAPVFESSYEDISAQVGSDVEVTCFAAGDPQPEYAWHSETGDEITENDETIYVKNSDNGGTILFIKNVTPELSGIYTCSAKNVHGLVTKIHRITIKDASEKEIEEIKVLEVTENSVLFDIRLGNAAASNWEITGKYNESNDKEATIITWKKGDKFEVRDLVIGGRYDFNFRIAPEGPWSESIQVVLLPSEPQVIFRSLTGGNLVIQMYRMLSDVSRSNIDKYRVSYNTVKIEKGNSWLADSCVVTTDIPICNFGRYEIAGLSKNTYYEIRVEAHTESGYGKAFRHKFFIA